MGLVSRRPGIWCCALEKDCGKLSGETFRAVCKMGPLGMTATRINCCHKKLFYEGDRKVTFKMTCEGYCVDF